MLHICLIKLLGWAPPHPFGSFAEPNKSRFTRYQQHESHLSCCSCCLVHLPQERQEVPWRSPVHPGWGAVHGTERRTSQRPPSYQEEPGATELLQLQGHWACAWIMACCHILVLCWDSSGCTWPLPWESPVCKCGISSQSSWQRHCGLCASLSPVPSLPQGIHSTVTSSFWAGSPETEMFVLKTADVLQNLFEQGSSELWQELTGSRNITCVLSSCQREKLFPGVWRDVAWSSGTGMSGWEGSRTTEWGEGWGDTEGFRLLGNGALLKQKWMEGVASGSVGIMAWLGLEGPLKISFHPLSGQGHLPPDPVAQTSIQPSLEHF